MVGGDYYPATRLFWLFRLGRGLLASFLRLGLGASRVCFSLCPSCLKLVRRFIYLGTTLFLEVAVPGDQADDLLRKPDRARNNAAYGLDGPLLFSAISSPNPLEHHRNVVQGDTSRGC